MDCNNNYYSRLLVPTSKMGIENNIEMRTPVTYYGGKQRLASKIISMMPTHKIYCEPFFGGGAVFFQKPKSGLEVVNDKNEMLINFYLCTQNKFHRLSKLIGETLHSEILYRKAKDIWNGRIKSTSIEKAWAVWIITNGSFAGSMYGGWKWDNGTSGSHSAIMIRNKRNEFSKELHIRLSDVQISCRDALRVIKERDSPNTFFYLDPPYPGCVQGHYSGYTHKDLFNLLEQLSSINGKFILSNYWCQTLRFFVAKNGWYVRKFEVNLKVANLGNSPLKKRTEILIYNYEIDKMLFDDI